MVVAFHRRVHDGELLQADDGGADEERHEGEARAVALLESGFGFVAQLHNAGEIDLKHAVHVGAGAARFDHALGDDLAHLRHGDEVAGDGGGLGRRGGRRDGRWRRSGNGSGRGRSRGGFGFRDEIHDVLLGDAATEARSGYLREIEIVIAGDLAHERRRARVVVFFVLCRRCGLHGRSRRRSGGRNWRGSFRRRGGRGGFGCSGGFAVGGDGRDYGVDLHGRAFGNLDVLQHAGSWGGNFGVHFIGGDLEERFVALYFVAGLLQPLGDGALKDGLAHLRHDDVSRHGFLPRFPSQACRLDAN